MSDVLVRLGSSIDARRHGDAAESYTASLFADGDDAILKKVGEEAIEFLLAAKGNDPKHLVSEAADVWFHMLVMLSARGLGPEAVLEELQRREGVSGHIEKASRESQQK